MTEPAPPLLIDPNELALIAEIEGWDFAAEVVALFEEEARRRMAQIADALATDDIAVIQDHAHALKSSAGTIGACRVAVLAQQLETAPLDEALARRVADFQACVADTKRALATLLQQRRLPLAPKE